MGPSGTIGDAPRQSTERGEEVLDLGQQLLLSHGIGGGLVEVYRHCPLEVRHCAGHGGISRKARRRALAGGAYRREGKRAISSPARHDEHDRKD